jgi:2-polyprenyl-3-methyl-5-hydroxy-6-metoxy-1,4-benzoquinol methylase
LIYANPRMTQASFTQFYDCEYRQLYHGKEHPIADLYKKNIRRGQRISAFLRDASVNLEGRRVLEVGCGAGGILSHFRDEFHCEVKGCDFGSQGVEYGVSHHGLDLEVGTLASMTLPWKPDIIIYSHVLEHVLSLRDECMRIREVLSDDGTVYIEVPSVKGIRQNYDWDFLELLQNAHTFHFTLTTLTNLMCQCGFELLCGNEFTQSAFKKSPLLPQDCTLVSDYECTMRFLKSTERNRAFGQIFNRLRRLPRRLAVSCIDRLGLTHTVKRILRK